LDHVLIFGVQHLRRILTSYSCYYNETRTHISLDKDAPLGRTVKRQGTIVAGPILSGCIIAMRGYDFREEQVSNPVETREDFVGAIEKGPASVGQLD
jgi:hypothetical protein